MLKKLIKSGWLALLCACCQLASAASAINVSATPANPTASANVTLAVTLAPGSDPVMVTQVEYFMGSQSLGKALAAPYRLAVNNMAAGTYVITAKASVADAQGTVLTSPALKLAVAAPAGAAGVYFVHSDQLNTPRAVTNSNGDLVWSWDSSPFGNEAANERPAGKAPFVMNLRFPGQYYDKETNLHYNYFRDYDPQLGRYVQSDPIGLRGGINTYGYVRGNPVSRIDPLGLCDTNCSCPGGVWDEKFGDVGFSVAAGGYYSRTRIRMVCRSNNAVVASGTQTCIGGGPIAGIGIGGVISGTTYGAETSSGLSGWATDQLQISFGPVGFQAPINGDPGGSVNGGISFGGGVAYSSCYTNITKVTCPEANKK